MKTKRRIFDFELKEYGAAGSTFEGLASGFHTVDSYIEIVAPGSFQEKLAEFLATGFIGGLNHNWDDPIGKPTSAVETPRGLEISANITDTAHGEDCKKLLRDKVVQKLSIGFTALAGEWLETFAEVQAYWDKWGYTPTAQDISRAQFGAYLITKIRLYEVSPVTLPACDICDITAVKSDESPAGLRLDDHVLSVLAALETLAGRVEGLAAKRAAESDGQRGLSPQRLAQLKAAHARLGTIITTGTPRRKQAARAMEVELLDLETFLTTL